MLSRRRHLMSVIALSIHLPMAASAQRHSHDGHGALRPGSGASAGGPAHATIEMDHATGPRLRADVVADGSGRYELRLSTENFSFAPEALGETRVVGSGHAHLYVDGRKIGRVYAASSRLPALAPGVHVVDVELAAADHAVYVVDGRPVATRIVLRTGTPRAKPIDRPVRAFDLSLEQGAVARQVLRAVQGETVRIHWRSDAPTTLHLHGYEIEAEIDPGRPLTMQFDADIPGRFPIASQGSACRGGHVHRALTYLEVHPK